MARENQAYPKTEAFLKNRLRHLMTSEEKALLEEVCAVEESVASGTVVLEAGRVYDKSMILIEGFMLRTLEAEGRKHIVGLQVPGDFVDLHSFALKRLDHNIEALGPCRVAYAQHTHLREAIQGNAHFARVLWFATLLDAAIHREWILKSKQLRADARAAHFMAETWARLDLVGCAKKDGFTSPLTQGHIAEICGTTPVHLSRCMSSLNAMGLGEFRRGRFYCNDRAGLEAFGKFDPAYLYGDDTLGMVEELQPG
ncbi:Crp/Fnr family transcriptional regulator [Erythrobacter westpacificensis]|uniref:Crp/Fnr family transcriptional regulator n=1 Tax=Erythrobacter westpacificensis TaxID=1055231 RepID=A0ABP9JZN7_9SPHN